MRIQLNLRVQIQVLLYPGTPYDQQTNNHVQNPTYYHSQRFFRLQLKATIMIYGISLRPTTAG